jgi:hypothetical protein
MKIVEITISSKGESVIHTKGFSGSSCRQASRPFEEALGLVAADQPTAEMYESQPLIQANQQKLNS